MTASYFEFTSFDTNSDFTEFNFHYKTSQKDGKEVAFIETLQFPTPPIQPAESVDLKPFLFNLHLILGVSYYKLFLPKTIVIKSGKLTQSQAKFWDTVYTKGLGEFFYRNKIDFRGLVNFPSQEKTLESRILNLESKDRVLLGLGGGKDSLISADILKANNIDTTAFIIETASQSKLIDTQLKALNLDSIVVKRTLDKKLVDGVAGAYQGHVPFSAITAFVGLLTAVLYDFKYIAVGNERSANEGNVEYLGEKINHQWSKTSEFEKLFRAYVSENLVKDVEYFSITRPLSELKIAQLLSERPQYFKLFSSCNRNFTISVNRTIFSWCGTCPKCAFTFLLLSAFLPKEKVIDIVVNDLLNNTSLLELYKEMLGVTEMKPFECVGTYDEVKAAFYLTHKRGEFEDSPAMKFFVANVLPKIKDPEKLVKKELTVDEPTTIPGEFQKIITNITSAR